LSKRGVFISIEGKENTMTSVSKAEDHPDARRLSAYLGAREPLADLTQRLQNLRKFHALFRSEDYHPFVEVLLMKK
jgi:hypothetical protein